MNIFNILLFPNNTPSCMRMGKDVSFPGKITSNGQIQIPKRVRESEELEEGDFVDVEIKSMKGNNNQNQEKA